MKVLFVCTGNTCRSSMAVALARSLTSFEVRSAGVAAEHGAPAAAQAIEVMKGRGLDLSSHRAELVDGKTMDWADVVLTMTRRHKEILAERFPESTHKVYTLKEYALDEDSRNRLGEKLDALFRRVDEKRREFAARQSPNIAELQQKRAELRRELEEVEHRLAELQCELRNELYSERAEIAQLELLLTEDDVADPFSQGPDVYETCAKEIETLLKRIAQTVKEE